MKRPLQRVSVDAYAKVNIGWSVGTLREDGFHDVNGVIQTIDLRDTLEMEVVDAGCLVTIDVPGHPGLETPDNLVVRAAEAVAGRMRDEPTPVRVVLHKRIPVAAGLGGGSADAAATLVGLNALWGAGLSARDLVDLGASIGSDVVPILIGGLVHVSGRGEVVRPIGSTSGYGIVLGVSAAGISAADAYRAFDDGARRAGAAWFHNDLESAALSLMPSLAKGLHVMRDAAGVAFVSGSGPTVVGITGDPDGVAAAVAGAFRDVLCTGPSDRGVQLRLGS